METATEEGQPQAKERWLARPLLLRTTREALLRRVREYCGDVDPVALAKLTALPAHHAIPNLDVRGTDQAHPNGQSKSRIPMGLEDSGAGEQPPRITEPALYQFVSQGD
jgi:hypothetical protein